MGPRGAIRRHPLHAAVVVLLCTAMLAAVVVDGGAGDGWAPTLEGPPVGASGDIDLPPRDAPAAAAEVPTELPAAASPDVAKGIAPGAAPAAGTAPRDGGSAPVLRRPPPRPNRASQPNNGAPAPATSNARFDGDVPDPALLHAAGTYWAFGTQSGTTQIQVLASADLATWEHRGDALAHLPPWAEWGWAWAPSVLARPSGYVLYYTTRHRLTGLQCISLATSVVPQGPYVDTSAQPLICQTDRGGSIDPQPFVDRDGTVWLLWKSEGTVDGEPTRIWVRRVSADGLILEGAAFELLATARSWEHPIIEGPAMVRVDGAYHLLYAGNRWETADYAIGQARCASVTGPCERVGDGRLFGSSGPELGPGSPAPLALATGDVVLGYHAWTSPAVGYPAGARRLHLGRLVSQGDRLAVERPWQPLPA